jgi:hypothetical protein
MIRGRKKLTVQPAGKISAQISKTSSKNQAAIKFERGACHDNCSDGLTASITTIIIFLVGQTQKKVQQCGARPCWR